MAMAIMVKSCLWLGGVVSSHRDKALIRHLRCSPPTHAASGDVFGWDRIQLRYPNCCPSECRLPAGSHPEDGDGVHKEMQRLIEQWAT